MFVIIMTLLSWALVIIFFAGQGGEVITGFKKAKEEIEDEEEEKERKELEKKLSRIAGFVLLPLPVGMTVILAGIYAGATWLPWFIGIFAIVIAAIVIIAIIIRKIMKAKRKQKSKINQYKRKE